MQTSQKRQSSYHQSNQIEPFRLTGPHFQILNNNGYPNSLTSRHQEPSIVSGQSFIDQFFTLESSPAIETYNSPFPSVSSTTNSRSPFSPQGSSQSCLSNLNNNSSPENTYGSPFSNEQNLRDQSIIREMEIELLGPGSDIEDGSITSSFDNVNKYHKMLQLDISNWGVKELLVACAEAMDADEDTEPFMEALQSKVSVTGDPIQRLGAYMLEGLRARKQSSGSVIYKKLKCYEPTPKELLSYMSVLYDICPYYKFAYKSANVVIKEAFQNENHVHVIDFLIAQGSQWVELIEDLARRPGGPPSIRVTGVDDGDSSYARAGGLELVGQRLTKVAQDCGVLFEFHAAARSGSEVDWNNLYLHPGEALAVNFPYMLHHMPDESVTTVNHRDRLIQLVKSLNPKVVTLLEQESNTNTSSFPKRFEEALDYYTAMFESIDTKLPKNTVLSRDDRKRISAEENCVARDMVNIVACEDTDRVERHEPLAKWRFRLQAAGFKGVPVSPLVGQVVKGMLSEYSDGYSLGEKDDALVLGWKNRPMVTCSAWR